MKKLNVRTTSHNQMIDITRDVKAAAVEMGSSMQVIVEEGRLQLGTWQSIYLCEFDGPRSRKVWVSTQ